jgi:chromosome segregation ATPase
VNELTDRTPVVIAAEINSIKEHTRNMILHGSIEIGRRLVEAKEMLPHGEWGKWLEKSVDYSQRTADNLMQIYKEYGNSNSQSIANLPYTKAVALLGIPAEEREQFAQENDILNITVRKLQQAIDEKKKIEEDLKSAQEEKQNLFSNYKKLEQSNRENYEKAERLRRELEEAKASGSLEEVEQLSEQLAKTDNELSIAQQKIKDLEREIKETPVEVTTAVTEKIPEEVQRELDELRKQSNKPIIKFTYCFETLVNGFKDVLGALSEIPNPEDQEKYKHAVRGLIGKMSERL